MKTYSIDEIEGMLGGVTRGEWSIKDNGGKGCLVGVVSDRSNWFIAEQVLAGDAQFIAAAPSIIRQLLAERKEIRRQAFEEAAEHLMEPQSSATAFCCLSTLSRASDELRRKAEQEIGNGGRIDDNNPNDISG